MKIAVLITCHNRRDKTMHCLDDLFSCDLPEATYLEVFLVDDGSIDGTAVAVRDAYPQVHVLQGDGDLYWNGGMRKAFAAAMAGSFDFYLWLNDDTYLYRQALTGLLQVASDIQDNGKKEFVVVGSTQEYEGGKVNHGGVTISNGWWSSKIVEPREHVVPCDTLNGNCVLISKALAVAVGNLDPIFIHTMGDIDYGLRIKAAGFPLVVMPGYAGICQSNPVSGTYEDVTLPLRARLSKIAAVKGRPLRPWLAFHWRHFGWLGLIYWSGTYAKVLVTWLRHSFSGAPPK